MEQIYETAAYDRWLDHAQPIPPPALRPSMAEWIEERMKDEG